MLRWVLVAGSLAASVAVAQNPGSSTKGPTSRQGPSSDPEEVVCVRQQAIGSRLGARRVCRTRAEWAQHQLEYKQEVERAQHQLQTSCAPVEQC